MGVLEMCKWAKKSWSGHSHAKGGRMIVLQMKKIPLSLIFSDEEKTPFFKNADLKITLFQWK